MAFGVLSDQLFIDPKPAIDYNNGIVFKGAQIHGISGRRMFDTWYQCESFLRRRPQLIEPLISHRLPFHRFEEGIHAMQDGSGCKVVLDWTEAKG